MGKRVPSLQQYVKKPEKRLCTRICEGPSLFVSRWYRRISSFVGDKSRSVLRTIPYVKAIEDHERHIRHSQKDISMLKDDISFLKGRVEDTVAKVKAAESAESKITLPTVTSVEDASMTVMKTTVESLTKQVESLTQEVMKLRSEKASAVSQTVMPVAAAPAVVPLPSAGPLHGATAAMLAQAKSKMLKRAGEPQQEKKHNERPVHGATAEQLLEAKTRLSKPNSPKKESVAKPPAPVAAGMLSPTILQHAAKQLRKVAAPEVASSGLTSGLRRSRRLSHIDMNDSKTAGKAVVRPALDPTKLRAFLAHPAVSSASEPQLQGQKRSRSDFGGQKSKAQPSKLHNNSWAQVVSNIAPPAAKRPRTPEVEPEARQQQSFEIPITADGSAKPDVTETEIVNDENIELPAPTGTKSVVLPIAKIKPAAVLLSPELLSAMSPKLRRTGLDRSPGGTPLRMKAAKMPERTASSITHQVLIAGIERKFGVLRRAQQVASPASSGFGSPFSPF